MVAKLSKHSQPSKPFFPRVLRHHRYNYVALRVIINCLIDSIIPKIM